MCEAESRWRRRTRRVATVTAGARGSPPPGALIDRMPRAAHPRMAPEQPKYTRCGKIGMRGSPSRRFLRRGGVPIPPVTAALGPLPPRGERPCRRPAPRAATPGQGLGERTGRAAGPSSRARTRATARRSAGRQGQACRSPATSVRSQIPRYRRAGCRTTPDTHLASSRVRTVTEPVRTLRRRSGLRRRAQRAAGSVCCRSRCAAGSCRR